MISIWEKESFYAPQDVVIVGSGFVGLWSALYLKKKNPKQKITILDRGVIPTGASTKNAGFACFGSLTELSSDAKSMGTDKMLELVEMRYKGMERIQKYFGEEVIDFELSGGYELFDSNHKLSAEQLQYEIEYSNTLLKPITGSKKTYRLIDDKIHEFGFGKIRHLVKNNFEGVLHSGKLVKALLQQVQSMGVQVLTTIEVKSFESSNSSITLTTNQPFNLTTGQLLICTNAFAKELLPEADIIPARGQVLLTSPINNLPFKGSFHFEEGFYYFRNLGNRVLLGGARNKDFESERTTELSTSDFIQNDLEVFLSEVILPQYNDQYNIDMRWSGIMGMGTEKMPIVQEVQPNIFCAVRMSGMGVALAPIVGQKIAQMMQ